MRYFENLHAHFVSDSAVHIVQSDISLCSSSIFRRAVSKFQTLIYLLDNTKN